MQIQIQQRSSPSWTMSTDDCLSLMSIFWDLFSALIPGVVASLLRFSSWVFYRKDGYDKRDERDIYFVYLSTDTLDLLESELLDLELELLLALDLDLLVVSGLWLLLRLLRGFSKLFLVFFCSFLDLLRGLSLS